MSAFSLMSSGSVTSVSRDVNTGSRYGAIPSYVPEQYRARVQSASDRTGVPAGVIAGVIQNESRWNTGVGNGSAGEIGIAQIKPSTAQQPGYGVTPMSADDARDPNRSIDFAADYIAGRSPGTDWNDPAQAREAVARYNSGSNKYNYADAALRNAEGATGSRQSIQRGIERYDNSAEGYRDLGQNGYTRDPSTGNMVPNVPPAQLNGNAQTKANDDGKIGDWVAQYFIRAVVIILGLVFVGAGIALFGKNTILPKLEIAK